MDKKMLITVQHNTKEISRVLQTVEQDTNYNLQDALFRWPPMATGILNTLCHPIIIIINYWSTVTAPVLCLSSLIIAEP